MRCFVLAPGRAGENGVLKDKQMKKEQGHFQWRRIASVLLDAIWVNLAYFGAMWIRFDFRYSLIPYVLSKQMILWAPLFTVLALGIYFMFRMYQSLSAFVGFPDLIKSFLANLVYVGSQFVLMRIFFHDIWVPLGFYLIEFFMLFIGISAHRFMHRLQRLLENNMQKGQLESSGIPTLVVGAGEAGHGLIHEMNTAPQVKNYVVAIIDDDPVKRGRSIEGVKIYGGREEIPSVVRELGVEEIILAMPSAQREEQREILEICKTTEAKLKIVPGIYQIISGEVSVSKVRDVSLDDLLGREPIQINTYQIADDLVGKTVLVTGGGGTIGGELCRQIARFGPKQIVILDIAENTSYEVQMELRRHYPELDIQVRIGSIRDAARVESLFEEYRPDVVYHAAAHKHVHLMEMAPHESVKNNVFGTLNVARAANKYHVKRFVLISTDKAVNPTSIYGAGKRMCEMIIQMFAQKSKETEFVAVRFGNVLGSSGSVIPLFKKEIAEGGPVTVTHPDIVRFFMTIEEAVSLVLQAGAYAKGGEIFVLDMGEPVRILDLAKNMIRLSGLRPGEDIDIVFTGLRPGEKLYEEVLMSEEGLHKTANERIRIAEPLRFDAEFFAEKLTELKNLIDTDEHADLYDITGEMVDTFKIPINGIPVPYAEYKANTTPEERAAAEYQRREHRLSEH